LDLFGNDLHLLGIVFVDGRHASKVIVQGLLSTHLLHSFIVEFVPLLL
jgi:hypothetical protein